MHPSALRLDTMKFFGRLARDYHEMFGVSLDQLRGMRVLDCPAGRCRDVPSTYERGNAAQNQLNSSLVIERRA